MNVATQYSEELRAFHPIAFKGLDFYPLTVKHFALYQNAKPAMELMLSTLPIRYVRYSWIQALLALDLEAQEEQKKTGFFTSILLLLDCALHTDLLHDSKSLIPVQAKDGTFGALVVRQPGKEATVLAESDFSEVREILAAQNNYTIPDENWNPELVRAQAYLRDRESGSVSGGSLEDAVFALAAATGQRAGEIWDWPIREFLQMQSAVDRRLRFQLYTAAELSGQVKFKHGNPYPTWIWEQTGKLPRGFTSIQELDEGAGGTLAIPNN